MTSDEFKLLLYDRIEMIKLINQKYDLENNAYISFSGGKDSTILHYLIDLALPDNKIPRVFINTGIEYIDIVKFVKDLASKDERFVILKPTQAIKPMLEKYGYPFKSKEHALKVFEFNRSGLLPYLKKYVEVKTEQGEKIYMSCPAALKYQFTEDFKNNGIKISHLCCKKLKKEPIRKWEKENNKIIGITGMRNEEGGYRIKLGCITQKGKRFNPLVKINNEFEDWFINEYNIKLCKLYYAPFNFKRTGCKGCPFALELQEQLDIMEQLLPHEKKSCEMIWQPVYEEYRRIGYRLRKKDEPYQMKLFI